MSELNLSKRKAVCLLLRGELSHLVYAKLVLQTALASPRLAWQT